MDIPKPPKLVRSDSYSNLNEIKEQKLDNICEIIHKMRNLKSEIKDKITIDHILDLLNDILYNEFTIQYPGKSHYELIEIMKTFLNDFQDNEL